MDSPSIVDADLIELEPAQVEDALRALGAALRSFRLYEGNNPMVDRFVAALQEKLGAIWERVSQLRLQVEEDRILWEGHEVFPSGESGAELPFLFYKDGIREVSLLPGFEETEARELLGVLARAPVVRQEEDDLITLLWQEDFAYFRYETVEAGVEGIELYSPSGGERKLGRIDATAMRATEAMPQGLSTDNFQGALYFLDESELRRLRDEVARESSRDLWRDVLNALLDRLEDGDPERQERIVAILTELLPSALGSAQFERSAALLEDLVDLAGRPGVLSPAALGETRAVFDQLGREETIIQLADILEEMPHRLSEDAVLRLLGYFPPGSIASLMRAAERVEQPGVRRAFEICIQRLAEANRDEVVGLLGATEPSVLAGALRWIGRLAIGSAVNEIVRFLGHGDVDVRIAAIDSLVSLRAAATGGSLIPLLQDENRDVRVAAARALGALSYVAARGPLGTVLGSKSIREADRLEKLAFFEAFGRLSGAEGVAVLDRILNAKSWLGQRENAEVRACAAQGLAKIRHPSARESLKAAANDADPVVRTAVTRALRGAEEA